MQNSPENWHFFGALASPNFIFGTIILYFGVWLRVWSINTLGKYFTGYIAETKQKDNQTGVKSGDWKLIKTGPYSLVIIHLFRFGLDF